jgi:cytochrome c nitrite reductase small subunit
MRLLLNSLLGILLGAGSYTFYYARGASYLSNDPQACVSCHVMRSEYDGWEKASHHAFATCNDCHMPHDFFGKWLAKASNGYHHSLAFTLWNFRDPIRIKPGNAGILNANCLCRCSSA